jgi:hypothetical protein
MKPMTKQEFEQFKDNLIEAGRNGLFKPENMTVSQAQELMDDENYSAETYLGRTVFVAGYYIRAINGYM